MISTYNVADLETIVHRIFRLTSSARSVKDMQCNSTSRQHISKPEWEYITRTDATFASERECGKFQAQAI